MNNDRVLCPPCSQSGWLLLDTLGMPGVIERFKQRFENGYPWSELFAETELQQLRGQGPLLLRMSPGSPLSAVLQQEPAQWPGLHIVCSVPKQQLLDHLRRMLIVRFGGHYKSLLAYYSVQTASYFFDATDAHELSRWMGPIHSLTWYGGSWSDKAEGIQGRQFVINPALEAAALTVEPALSQKQEAKLQQCLIERHAYFASRGDLGDFQRTLEHVHEGLNHGFNNTVVLDLWLALRARFPKASVPSSLRGSTQQMRFEHLSNYWQSGRS